MFVDATDLPDAYKLIGRYRVSNEKVTATVKMFEGKKDVAQFSVSGARSDVDAVARDIVTSAEDEVEKLPQAK